MMRIRNMHSCFDEAFKHGLLLKAHAYIYVINVDDIITKVNNNNDLYKFKMHLSIIF